MSTTHCEPTESVRIFKNVRAKQAVRRLLCLPFLLGLDSLQVVDSEDGGSCRAAKVPDCKVQEDWCMPAVLTVVSIFFFTKF